jgi:hypothetical protein
MAFDRAEINKIETYLQRKFGNQTISLKQRKTGDSLEVLIKDEFIGVIYKDEDEGEISYDFNMAILDMDLEEAA